MLRSLQMIIATIISIWNSVKSLFGFFREQKIEKIREEDLKKEDQKESKVIEDAVVNKDLDRLNDLAGWKE